MSRIRPLRELRCTINSGTNGTHYGGGTGLRPRTSVALHVSIINDAAPIAFAILRQLNPRPYVMAFLAYNATAVVWCTWAAC
jgi:hypothetical protein